MKTLSSMTSSFLPINIPFRQHKTRKSGLKIFDMQNLETGKLNIFERDFLYTNSLEWLNSDLCFTMTILHFIPCDLSYVTNFTSDFDRFRV